MEPQRQARRVGRFLIFRLAVVPIAFALVAICRASAGAASADVRILTTVLLAWTVLVVASLAAPAPIRNRRWFVAVQVGVDLAAEGALIWLTGGVGSVFCPLLITSLFNATTALPGREPLLLAALSTVFLAVTTIGYQFLGPPAISSWDGRGLGLEYGAAAHLVALGLALHAVALLGTRLSRGLRSVQNLQEEILENMAEGLVAVDGETRILELNGEARRIFGLDAETTCLGRRLSEVFGDKRLRTVLEALLGAERRRFEFVQGLPGGGTLPVEGKVSSIPGEGGGVRARIGLFGDQSLKKGIQQAERRIHKLEELYDMAMAIAHEIRNPLASIRGCAQEIGRSPQRSGREAKLVDIICRESDRLDRIIEEFMTNARRGPLSLRPVDLVSVVEETTVQLRNHPKTAGRSIELEASPGQALVGGDRERLKQVFLNLGMNAIEATDPSAGLVKFSVRFQEALAQNRRRAGERLMLPGVEVAVEDNGAGMRPETQAMAFMPFFTTKESGHGLGLAIVHRIVRDHLGRVDIESAPGNGSRFKVWFPLARTEDAVEERQEEVAHAL